MCLEAKIEVSESVAEDASATSKSIEKGTSDAMESPKSSKKKDKEAGNVSAEKKEKERERELSPKSLLNRKLEKHKDKLEREKKLKELSKERAKECEANSSSKTRKPLIDDSDNSSNEDESTRKSQTPASSIVEDAHKLSSAMVLDKLNFELMKALSVKHLDHERAKTCLSEMKNYLTSNTMAENSDVVTSIKRIRKYKKDKTIQEKAEEICDTMRSLLKTADPDVVNKLAEEKKKRHSEMISKQATNQTSSDAGNKSHVESKPSGDDAPSEAAAKLSSEESSEVVETSKAEVTEVLIVNTETASSNEPEKPTFDHKEEEEEKLVEESKEAKAKVVSSEKPAVQYFFMMRGATNDGKDSEKNVDVSSKDTVIDVNGHLSNGAKTPTRDELQNDDTEMTDVHHSSENSGSQLHENLEMAEQPPAMDVDSALGI